MAEHSEIVADPDSEPELAAADDPFDLFAAWFSESKFERHQFIYRLSGDHAWVFWTMTLSNCVAPLL